MTEIQSIVNTLDTSTDLDRKSDTPNTSSARQAHGEWVIKVSNEVENLADNSSKESERWKRQSVYTVPSSVKDLCKTAYEPQEVSIGPYHHGKPHLKAMEEHKHRALLHFLKRSRKPTRCFLDALAQVVMDLKDAYDQLDENWQQDTEAFLKLMIVDGCFILELLRTTTSTPTTADQRSPHVSASKHGKLISTSTDDQSSYSKEKHIMMGYADNDPVFSKHGKLYIVPYLKRDMLMLENQIPMLVLTTLLSTAGNDVPPLDERLSKEEEVTRLIVKFFSQQEIKKPGKCLHILDVYRKSLLLDRPVDDSNKTKESRSQNRECLHILDVYLKSLLLLDRPVDESNKTKESSSQNRECTKQKREKYVRIIHSATDLREAGVRIKPSATDSLNDIKFHRRTGVLELPRIVVDDTLESQYLNLMAFERFHVEAGLEITSYVLFMDNLIDSPRDVSLLHKRGIVRNEIGSQKAITNLFNSTWTISRGISLRSKSTLDHVSKEISDYCQQPCPRWRASLKHRYFTNPWAGLSVFAAIFLFALAGIQTVYNVLSYYGFNK